MRRKRYTPEQVIGRLRKAEVERSRGEKVKHVCRNFWGSRRDLPPLARRGWGHEGLPGQAFKGAGEGERPLEAGRGVLEVDHEPGRSSRNSGRAGRRDIGQEKAGGSIPARAWHRESRGRTGLPARPWCQGDLFQKKRATESKQNQYRRSGNTMVAECSKARTTYSRYPKLLSRALTSSSSSGR